MRRLNIPSDENVLIGMATADDAGVYKISDELALIQTVDFFTPIVDDPYDFGCIAANALSDVYARGLTCPTPVLMVKDLVEKEKPRELTVMVESNLPCTGYYRC